MELGEPRRSPCHHGPLPLQDTMPPSSGLDLIGTLLHQRPSPCFGDRAAAIEALGFTARQARFLTLVALHSGYCLRRQYSSFGALSYGKNVRNFLDCLVDRQLA